MIPSIFRGEKAIVSLAPQQIGAVVIARNEGERLKDCLRSLLGRCPAITYVDSGSTDGSVEFARSLGVDVVELDLSKPFSMARARNAGFARVRKLLPTMEYVQFVDGDCELDPGWLVTAARWLDTHPETVMVCGRRRERFPERSIYNQLCDIEWDTPIGPAVSCGGDALVRVGAFATVNGFNEDLIAGEEPELCLRLRNAGGQIDRIAAEMTRHDAAILTFSAWWARTVRTGYGALDVFTRLKGQAQAPDIPFHLLTNSASLWTDQWLAGLALSIATGTLFGGIVGALLGVLIPVVLWIIQAWRIGNHVKARTTYANAMRYGVFTMLGKWAHRIGQRRYRRDVRLGRVSAIIEYKQ